MEFMALLSKIVIGLGLLNVWLRRRRKATGWRGGEARNMKEEYEVYGLPAWALGVVGFTKVSLALLIVPV